MLNKKTSISVYGIGNFGYAFLKHLDNKQSPDISLKAYDRNALVTRQLQLDRTHPYFHKNTKLSKNVVFAHSPKELLEKCDLLILAVSSDATRQVLQEIKPLLNKSTIILNTAKALDYGTGERLSVLTKEIIGIFNSYACVAGGTIAKDLFKHEPLGVDIACENKLILSKLVSLIKSDNLAVYPTTDLLGIEYASSFKNVVSIFAGIVKGMGFSYGSETHMISYLSQTIGDVFVSKYGADPTTFSMGSQSWGNDLWMSCTGKTRNREFGVLLGSGDSVDDAINKMYAAHKTVEGINTIEVLDHLEPLRSIKELELLYRLIVKKDISVDILRKFLLTNTVN